MRMESERKMGGKFRWKDNILGGRRVIEGEKSKRTQIWGLYLHLHSSSLFSLGGYLDVKCFSKKLEVPKRKLKCSWDFTIHQVVNVSQYL